MQLSQDPIKPLMDRIEHPSDTIDDLKMSVMEASEKIKGMADTLRMRMSLAQLEIRDISHELLEGLDTLSVSLQENAHKLDKKISDSQVQFHLALMEAQEKWEYVKGQTARLKDALKMEEVPGSHILDDVFFKTSLAKTETREFLGKSRDELHRTWQMLSQKSLGLVKKMNEGIGGLIHRP